MCPELGFPVSVLERSPLVLRDLDLLKDISGQVPSVVFFSLISHLIPQPMSVSARWDT